MKMKVTTKYELSNTEYSRLLQIPTCLCNLIDCEEMICEDCPFDEVSDKYRDVVDELRKVMQNMEKGGK